jgi:hypothetical protein
VAIRITREQRDAIYEEIMTEISGSGDVHVEMESGDYAAARRTRRRHQDAMRLLDDLGWEPTQDDQEFELTMEPSGLARAVASLTENACVTLHDMVARPLEEADLARRALIAQSA